MKNPKLISKPFALNGQKNNIPENFSPSMESNQATWDQGFGSITMIPVAAGGLPPKGQDFNGILNQISESVVHLSKGGWFKFSIDYATAIGGYPKGAILQSEDEKKVYQSLIDGNQINFNTATSSQVSASWKLIYTDSMLLEIEGKQPKGDYATKADLSNGLSEKQPVGDYATNQSLSNGLSGKLDKTAVTQSTGQSTSLVISQKGVSDALENKVNTTAIVQSTGANQYSIMSQKAVSDALDLKVNYTAIVQSTGQNQYSIMSQRAVTNILFGIGQTWKDMLSERTSGTTYTNSTGKPISVSVTQLGGQDITMVIEVGGVVISRPSSTGVSRCFITFTVPDGVTYKVTSTGSEIINWAELR
ncbi:hypothetical protein [Providencia sp. PROV117]|uniref:hypothetical protein n=1 Tax=Providencia sp. PROV117 TaxID=2949828 RepID=UPI00234B7DB9|nr:hypothetical protein [Providencia sp. PROV117]